MSITLIACLDMNNGIGAQGKDLFDFPLDKKHFKSITSGKHVVMGRKTWDSLPVKPLPKRKNYVLTTNKDFEIKGRTQILNSIEEVIELGQSHDVFVIGGGEIYNQMIEHADTLILTHVHEIVLEATVFFPEYHLKEWKLDKTKEHKAKKDDMKNPPSFTFATYRRRNK